MFDPHIVIISRIIKIWEYQVVDWTLTQSLSFLPLNIPYKHVIIDIGAKSKHCAKTKKKTMHHLLEL
jgi:hypothetical protein